MSDNKEKFTYSYSAKRREEINRIREKYAPRNSSEGSTEDKMERLRRLDADAARPGSVAAIVVGIISTLIMGVGMCCTMVWGGGLFVPGIIIGLSGIGGAASAYPLYSRITEKRRRKIAPEILKLTDELLK